MRIWRWIQAAGAAHVAAHYGSRLLVLFVVAPASAVAAGGDYGEKCSPYPLDVLAIRALYETR